MNCTAVSPYVLSQNRLQSPQERGPELGTKEMNHGNVEIGEKKVGDGQKWFSSCEK